MDLGQKIQKLRKQNKFSQEQLGELIGVTRQTISNWELNDSAPDIRQAKQLAKIFNISLDELTDNDNKEIITKQLANIKNLSKTTLSISIIHCLLFISIIIVITIAVINYYKVTPIKQAVEINCQIADNTFYYRLDLDIKTKEITAFNTNDEEMKQNFKYNPYENYENVLEQIKSKVINKGGKC